MASPGAGTVCASAAATTSVRRGHGRRTQRRVRERSCEAFRRARSRRPSPRPVAVERSRSSQSPPRRPRELGRARARAGHHPSGAPLLRRSAKRQGARREGSASPRRAARRGRPSPPVSLVGRAVAAAWRSAALGVRLACGGTADAAPPRLPSSRALRRACCSSILSSSSSPSAAAVGPRPWWSAAALAARHRAGGHRRRARPRQEGRRARPRGLHAATRRALSGRLFARSRSSLLRAWRLLRGHRLVAGRLGRLRRRARTRRRDCLHRPFVLERPTSTCWRARCEALTRSLVPSSSSMRSSSSSPSLFSATRSSVESASSRWLLRSCRHDLVRVSFFVAAHALRPLPERQSASRSTTPSSEKSPSPVVRESYRGKKGGGGGVLSFVSGRLVLGQNAGARRTAAYSPPTGGCWVALRRVRTRLHAKRGGEESGDGLAALATG